MFAVVAEEAVEHGPAFGFLILALIVIIGPVVARLLRLPSLIGLLIGGALIGPNMLDALDSYTGLEAVGRLGVLYLLFLAGLELDIPTFIKHRTSALTFGLLTSLVPWTFGTIVAVLAGYDGRTALLVGSFWASFTLVSYGVVTKYELTRNPSVASTVAACSMSDTVGLVALALIVGSVSGESEPEVVLLEVVGGLAVVAGFCLVILPAVTGWFFGGLGQERELRFLMILIGISSASVVAEFVGIEPLLGAFFAGLGMNRLVPNGSRLMERIDFFGNSLFVPAFLVSVGLLVNPSVMFQRYTLLLAIGLAAALISGKFVAAFATSRLYGYDRAEMGLMFSLSSAQTAATLAATVVGFRVGLYGDVMVNAVMVVIVISLFVTGIGSDYFAPRVDAGASLERRLGELVVVPLATDLDETNTVWLGGQVALSDGGMVVPLGVAVADEPDGMSEARAEVTEFSDTLKGLGLTGEPELRVARSVAGGVDRFMLENDGSLVLLTWPGPQDLRATLLGGGHDEIAAATDRPVAMVSMTTRSLSAVLVGITSHDLRPASIADTRLSLQLAARIASSSDVPLIFGPVTPEELEEARIELPKRANFVPGLSDKDAWVMDNSAADRLVVLPALGRPVSLMQKYNRGDHSLVVASKRRNDRWYAREGTLGITVPHVSTPTESDLLAERAIRSEQAAARRARHTAPIELRAPAPQPNPAAERHERVRADRQRSVL